MTRARRWDWADRRVNTRRAWMQRAAIALVAGIVVGVGSGVIGLRILTGDAPPPPVIPDVTEPATPAPRRAIRGPRADGMRGDAGALVGDGIMGSRDSVAVVPDLIGRAEGDARRLLERAGFTLGSILFREDDRRMGTVLETFPVPGERVPLPATVNLILADRRRPVDSLYFAPGDTAVAPPDSAPPDSAADSRAGGPLPVIPDSLP